MTAPGPHVTTGLRAGPPAVTAPPVATGFVPVISGYGPLTPQPIRSASEYRALYRPDYVDAAHPGLVSDPAELTAAVLETFFAEGGQLAYACRLVGASAVKATHVYVDRQGTPAPALTFTAKTAGVWGNDIRITVADGTSGTTYKLTFSLATAAKVLAPSLPIVLDNLATPAAGKAAIDAHPLLSTLVDVVAGTGVGATNRPAIADTTLTGGTDNTVGVTTALALAAFPADLGPGVVFGPALGTVDLGTFATGLTAAVGTLEATGRTAIFPGTVLGGDPDDAATNVAALRAALITAGDSEERADELLGYLGWFAPAFVLIPGANGATSPRSVPVTGYVAGERARTLASFGLGRTPAGEVTAARYVIGPTSDGATIDKVNDDDAATIDTDGGNAVRVIAGKTLVYGWRTMSSNSADWGWLSDRDTLNAIVAGAELIAEPYTFRKIDGKGQVFSDLRGDLIGYLAGYRAADVLYAELDVDLNEIDPGYSVDVGPDVNTAATIAAHQINADIGVRLSPTGSTVNISISKVAVGAPL